MPFLRTITEAFNTDSKRLRLQRDLIRSFFAYCEAVQCKRGDQAARWKDFNNSIEVFFTDFGTDLDAHMMHMLMISHAREISPQLGVYCTGAFLRGCEDYKRKYHESSPLKAVEISLANLQIYWQEKEFSRVYREVCAEYAKADPASFVYQYGKGDGSVQDIGVYMKSFAPRGIRAGALVELNHVNLDKLFDEYPARVFDVLYLRALLNKAEEQTKAAEEFRTRRAEVFYADRFDLMEYTAMLMAPKPFHAPQLAIS